MARVVVHEAEMNALLRSPGGAVAKDLMRRGRLVENRAKELVHVDTGRARASITMIPTEVDGEFAVQIGSNVDYTEYLERRFPFLQPALAAAF
jgi:hypothetical protein